MLPGPRWPPFVAATPLTNAACKHDACHKQPQAHLPRSPWHQRSCRPTTNRADASFPRVRIADSTNLEQLSFVSQHCTHCSFRDADHETHGPFSPGTCKLGSVGS